MKAYINPDFFEFFKKLAANNHKEWFDANRNAYETSVKKPFENLVDALLAEFTKTQKDLQGVQAKDCIFRINRDVRFSKDKSPYKLNRSAIISAGGKKEMHAKGFYLELGPGECAFYAGVYMPDKESITGIRNAISGNMKAFEKLISAPAFVKAFGEVHGDRQKRVDAALKEAAVVQPLILNTQFYIKHNFSEKTACSKGFVDYIRELADTALPFNSFLYKAMQ